VFANVFRKFWQKIARDDFSISVFDEIFGRKNAGFRVFFALISNPGPFKTVSLLLFSSGTKNSRQIYGRKKGPMPCIMYFF
jgi:hypothetical protein